MRVSTVTGSIPKGIGFDSNGKPCLRCGKDLGRGVGRKRKDGLILCRDCSSDKWFVEKMTA